MTRRIRRHITIICTAMLLQAVALAQPTGYYSSADGLAGTELKQELHNIIDNHTQRTYTNLWTDFIRTDSRSDGKVWDIYSDIPGGTPLYTYTFVTDQCGNYSAEGDCFNREHSFPKSWFGGSIYPMYSDLFHLIPTDGYVNNRRGNYPFGTTSSPSWTSSNGSRVGASNVTGYTGTVFEPIDEYKGDLARSMLYMAVRYYGEDGSWPGSDMTDGAEPKQWAIDLLLEWSNADPVSQKEINRNDSVYLIQGNRNPFIDDASYATKIWDASSSVATVPAELFIPDPWPNPASSTVNIDLRNTQGNSFNIKIISLTGDVLMNIRQEQKGLLPIDVSEIGEGTCFIVIETNQGVKVMPLVIIH